MSPRSAPEHSFPQGKSFPVGLTCSWWLTWLPAALSTSVLLLSSTISRSPWFPYSFDPIDLTQPRLRLTRLFLFICTVNLHHSFDPSSWQWSGNKPHWLNEKHGNWVSIGLQQGKWLCHKVRSWVKYSQTPRPRQCRHKRQIMCK